MKKVKVCKSCLLDDTMPDVEIDSTGLCCRCRRREPDTSEHQDQLQKLLDSARMHPAKSYDVVLAFSGGKDSGAVLGYLSRKGLSVLAVLCDNGFIPTQVKAQAQRVCRIAGATLELVQMDMTTQFRKSFARKSFDPAPCTLCMRNVFRILERVATREDVEYICTGHRFALGPSKPRSRGPSILPVPVAAGLGEEGMASERARIGFREVTIGGQTSNCLIPQAVEWFFKDWFGFNPAVYELSKEIRAGLLKKEEAREMLASKKNIEVDQGVLRRLGLISSTKESL